MDHYEALDADPTETETDLRRRYLKAARQYHPDQLTQASQAERDVAEDKMRAVNQAWNVLGDKCRRLQYDQSLFEEQHFQAQAEWKPYDDSPVAEYEEPMVPGRARPPSWMTAGPPILVGSGIFTAVIGAMTVALLLAIGIAMIVVGALSFVLAPFAVMVMSAQSEKRH